MIVLDFDGFMDESLDAEYSEFLEFLETAEHATMVGEAFNIMGAFGKAWETIKDIASKIGMSLSEVISVFKNRFIFGIFKSVGFSLQKIYELLKSGYEMYIKLQNALASFIARSPIIQKADAYAKWLDEFLDKNPFIKKAAGILIAYMLFYIWMNVISFTGNLDFDFNIQDMWDAIRGKKGFLDIFGGDNGAKMLTFIIAKQVGMSFPWPGASTVQFLFAVLYTLGTIIGKKLKKVNL